MTPLSYLSNAELDAFEGLYHQFQNDPYSVDKEWRNFFEGFEFSRTDFKQKNEKISVEGVPMSAAPEQFQKEIAVNNLELIDHVDICFQKPILCDRAANTKVQLYLRILV